MLDLQTVAQALLDNVIQQLTEMDIAVPGITCLAPGNEVAFDCEQLTVNLSRIISNFQTQDTTFPTYAAQMMSSAEFYITLVRCIPTIDDSGRMPSPQSQSDAAGVIMRDSRALKRGLEKIKQQHLVVPRNVPETVGELRTIGPSGGFAASTVMYTVMLVDDWWAADQPGMRTNNIGAAV
jgi:hypothetical protein